MVDDPHQAGRPSEEEELIFITATKEQVKSRKSNNQRKIPHNMKSDQYFLPGSSFGDRAAQQSAPGPLGSDGVRFRLFPFSQSVGCSGSGSGSAPLVLLLFRMGAAGSKKRNLRTDAFCSAKVRAARAFGEHLSNTNPENHNGADRLLSDSFAGQDCDSPDVGGFQNKTLPPHRPHKSLALTKPSRPHQPSPRSNPQVLPQVDPIRTQGLPGPSKRRLSVERSLSSEDPPSARGSQGSVALRPSRVYTITREGRMTLGGAGRQEAVELEVLKGPREPQPSNPAIHTQSSAAAIRGSHHHSSHSRTSHHHSNQLQGGPSTASQPLQSSRSASDIGDWWVRRGGSREDYSPDCVACIRAPCQSQRSLDLDSSPQDGEKHRKKLERVYSEDRTSTDNKDDGSNSWFPKENMFSFQTATTTMQAISAFRGIAERKRRKREQETAAMMERYCVLAVLCCLVLNALLLRPSGSALIHRAIFIPPACPPPACHPPAFCLPPPACRLPFANPPAAWCHVWLCAELQTSSGTLDEGLGEDAEWEEERLSCQGEDFIPPKVMLISSKVPKAEYVPNIIRRDDPSIIPILYDHEHATFDDILEEIEKKLSSYRKGCRIWNMLIFCQVTDSQQPGDHPPLLHAKTISSSKNLWTTGTLESKAKLFWRRLSRLMSKLNPEPNLIHVMGCYVLGSANGEKLIQTLKRLMRPSIVEFKSPLELSAQGKEMIEMYFDFRLYRLWKSRQHSKLLDYDDLI
ncbi:PREDICTED: NMDA receptor synaptonuclear signaling and neuronal migration factor-like [Cyprinodon variegatus]|uniref:NMDA receptor synaptonuclear signaling and neuronal migration factor-like n=1 Tax=Cyprinodon variegatus TaxID=28743 RepID=UPI000742B2FB|nr:PREDICTED: NMDA receptor synaptonuclear signaling and neuronal migration factor-like [Cyprinodon variegatus]